MSGDTERSASGEGPSGGKVPEGRDPGPPTLSLQRPITVPKASLLFLVLPGRSDPSPTRLMPPPRAEGRAEVPGWRARGGHGGSIPWGEAQNPGSAGWGPEEIKEWVGGQRQPLLLFRLHPKRGDDCLPLEGSLSAPTDSLPACSLSPACVGSTDDLLGTGGSLGGTLGTPAPPAGRERALHLCSQPPGIRRQKLPLFLCLQIKIK